MSACCLHIAVGRGGFGLQETDDRLNGDKSRISRTSASVSVDRVAHPTAPSWQQSLQAEGPQSRGWARFLKQVSRHGRS
jgi:hypothetical protein